MTATFNNIMKDLKAEKYHPVYFLEGEEPYYIDIISDYIATSILSDDEKAFNLQVYYGKDTSVETVITSARRFPMMSRYQVIVVKEAQQLGNMDRLGSYLSNPLRTTILVFCYKYRKLDKRQKITKLISETCILFTSDKLKEEKVPEWISGYISGKGFRIDPKAQWMLLDFLGTDLSKLSNELDKLIILMPAGQNTITGEHVEENIGMSKDYNSFELTKAFTNRDILKANRILNYFEKNPKNNPALAVLGMLFYYFTRILLYHGATDRSREKLSAQMGISPYFISEYQQAARVFSYSRTCEIISLLREYDVKLKGMDSSAPDSELMKELVFKILH